MKKMKRLTLFWGTMVCALAALLVMTANVNVPEKSEDIKGIYDNGSTSSVVFYSAILSSAT